jgi:hypothetical protein
MRAKAEIDLFALNDRPAVIGIDDCAGLYRGAPYFTETNVSYEEFRRVIDDADESIDLVIHESDVNGEKSIVPDGLDASQYVSDANKLTMRPTMHKESRLYGNIVEYGGPTTYIAWIARELDENGKRHIYIERIADEENE